MVRSFMLGWFIDRHKAEIAAEIENVLSELGEERVRFLVENNTSLWSIWPNKEEAITRLAPYADSIGQIDLNDLGDQVLKLLEESSSTFAPIISREWLIKSLREARREILQKVLK